MNSALGTEPAAIQAAYRPIADYAAIGDGRSVALISSDGSVDWLCLPRFDSPSVFAALLDARAGGRFRIRPTAPFETRRRYVADTNVLETTFTTSDGMVVVRDLMPVASEPDKRAALTPGHELLREVQGLSGEVEMEVVYEPRPDYGRARPTLRMRGPLGIWCDAGGALRLITDLPLSVGADAHGAYGTVGMRAGERRYLSLTFSEDQPAVLPALGAAAQARIERSIRWWQEWAARCTYRGPYRDMVVRSCLALKLMAYAPSGAVVAAPTTSLPEALGGVRNWDYRFCWLRDASFTVRALFALGYHEEAEAFISWMLHATRLTWPELQVVYDVFGEADLPEHELGHLEGYAGARPVRTGNDAHGQLQLDVYGEVIDAVAQFVGRGGRLDRDTTRLLDGLGRTVCKRWQEPDEGIWEVRSGRHHHTHSKALCWAALDRLVAMHEAGHIRVSADQFRATAEEIRAEIEGHGYNPELQSYTRVFGGSQLDASLLVLPHYGYIDAAEPRMRSTCMHVLDRLGRDGLVYRYEAETDDGLPPGEGAFGVCSFWAVECLAKGGDVEEATRGFERLLSFANDVGLYAEEIDPATSAHLGNFPQAFTHIGLINAALTCSECRAEALLAPAVEPPSLSVEDRQ